MPFIEPKASVSLAKIKVVGVGGGGQNAIDNMVRDGKVKDVEFIAMNTDMQALNNFSGQVRVQLGPEKTHGLGSGSDPTVARESAQESLEDIKNNLQGADMIFIAVGEGGGTGTGAAPIIAQVSKEIGALTVGIVTKPFLFEGKRRMNQAEQGIRELKNNVDALVVIPNEKILEIVDEDVPMSNAFKIADEVIGKAVEGISDLITSTGLINVDFADVKTVMKNAGSALMGVGQADGENRAEKAANEAIKSPLLDVDIKGSTGVLINIVGDSSMTMHEVNKAAKIVSDAAHEGANIIFGANIDPEVDGIRVTVIATGFETDFSTSIAGSVDWVDETKPEIIDQIESRFDEEQNSEDIDIQMSESDESTEFDLDQLRKEVEEMEKHQSDESMEKTDEKSKDVNDEKGQEEDKRKSSGGFWSFIGNKN